jgi:hypothetical protein
MKLRGYAKKVVMCQMEVGIKINFCVSGDFSGNQMLLKRVTSLVSTGAVFCCWSKEVFEMKIYFYLERVVYNVVCILCRKTCNSV